MRCVGQRSAVLASAMRDAWSRCLDDTVSEGAHSAIPAVPATPLEIRFDVDGDLAPQLMVTTQEITRSLITAQIGRLLMFHAGAVSNPLTGESLVYVAPGGTGKTTLTRRLGSRLGYLTDETVGMDTAGRIRPYPKPLSIRRPNGPGKDEVSPGAAGLLRAPASAHVTRIVLLDRQQPSEGAGVELEQMSFMDALFALVPQTPLCRISTAPPPTGRAHRPCRSSAAHPVRRGWRCRGRAGGAHRRYGVKFSQRRADDMLRRDGETAVLVDEARRPPEQNQFSDLRAVCDTVETWRLSRGCSSAEFGEPVRVTVLEATTTAVAEHGRSRRSRTVALTHQGNQDSTPRVCRLVAVPNKPSWVRRGGRERCVARRWLICRR